MKIKESEITYMSLLAIFRNYVKVVVYDSVDL